MNSLPERPEPPPLRLLYRGRHHVAIDKPAGLMDHRSRLSADRQFVLQRRRDQIGHRVYPMHRLDRATSGVLVLGLHPKAASLLSRAFEHRAVRKRYLAAVRDYPEDAAIMDQPLRAEERTVEHGVGQSESGAAARRPLSQRPVGTAVRAV